MKDFQYYISIFLCIVSSRIVTKYTRRNKIKKKRQKSKNIQLTLIKCSLYLTCDAYFVAVKKRHDNTEVVEWCSSPVDHLEIS